MSSRTVPTSSPSVQVASRDRLPSLTGLRFWAALLVVCYHLSRQLGDLPGISQLAYYGRSGVTFFFVLSGFVLAWTYVGGLPSLRVFFWRRFARVWPLHAVATTLSAGVYLALGVAVPLASVVAALGLVHAWVPDPAVIRGGNGATWSLSDEAFFYLCFPVLLFVITRLRRWAALAVGALAVAALFVGWGLVQLEVQSPFLRTWLLDYLPPVRVLQFVVGVALGVAVGKGWRPRVPLSLAVVVVVGYHLALLPWLDAVGDKVPWGPYSASQLFAVPAFALLVLAAVARDLEGRTGLLGRPWALRLGHWSFAWYLVHEIVLRVYVAWQGTPDGYPATVAGWLLVLVVSQTLAGLLYHVVEHPTERRLRGLVQPRGVRVKAVPAAPPAAHSSPLAAPSAPAASEPLL